MAEHRRQLLERRLERDRAAVEAHLEAAKKAAAHVALVAEASRNTNSAAVAALSLQVENMMAATAQTVANMANTMQAVHAQNLYLQTAFSNVVAQAESTTASTAPEEHRSTSQTASTATKSRGTPYRPQSRTRAPVLTTAPIHRRRHRARPYARRSCTRGASTSTVDPPRPAASVPVIRSPRLSILDKGVTAIE